MHDLVARAVVERHPQVEPGVPGRARLHVVHQLAAGCRGSGRGGRRSARARPGGAGRGTRARSSRRRASSDRRPRRSGRPQFSVEKAYTARLRTPRSGAASTVRRSARVPARWPASERQPAPRGPAAVAVHDDRHVRAPIGGTGSARARRRGAAGLMRPQEPYLLAQTVPPRGQTSMISASLALSAASICCDVLVGELLQPVLGAVHVVGAGVAVLLELLQVVDRVAADVARGHAPLLGHVPHLLHELLAPLLGELRDRQPDQLAVVGRRQAEVGLEDGRARCPS